MRRIAREIPPLDHFKFLSKIISTPDNECWTWGGFVENGRYGRFDIKNSEGKWNWFYAHRVSFLIFNGKLTDGLVVDHKCKNKSCVNPDHLREVTNRFNVVVNSTSKFAINAKVEKCPKGHPYSGKNLMMTKKGRACRECNREWTKKRYIPKPKILKTHCINGHEYTPENTLIQKKRWRSCLICRRINDLKRYHGKKIKEF